MRTFQGGSEAKFRCLDNLMQYRNSGDIGRWFLSRNHYGADSTVVHEPGRKAYDSELGLPLPLFLLANAIHLGLSDRLAQAWPIEFLTAIPIDVDLSQTWPKFACHFLTHPHVGVIGHAMTEEEHQAIVLVADLYRQECDDFDRWHQALCQAADAEPTTRPFRPSIHGYVASSAAYHAACVALNSFANATHALLFSIIVAEHGAKEEHKEQAYYKQAQKLLELLAQHSG